MYFLKKDIDIPYANEKTALLNEPRSQKLINEINPLCCPIHTFMLFLDDLAQEKKVSLMLIVVFYTINSKSGPKN